MTAPTPPAARILELLADRRWHDRSELLAEAAKTVPPGRAFRVGERERNRTERRPDGPGPRVRGDRTSSINTGARVIARSALANFLRHGTIQRDGERIRLARPPKSVSGAA